MENHDIEAVLPQVDINNAPEATDPFKEEPKVNRNLMWETAQKLGEVEGKLILLQTQAEIAYKVILRDVSRAFESIKKAITAICAENDEETVKLELAMAYVILERLEKDKTLEKFLKGGEKDD